MQPKRTEVVDSPQADELIEYFPPANSLLKPVGRFSLFGRIPIKEVVPRISITLAEESYLPDGEDT